MDKLLDLNLKNPLLNFRREGARTLRLVSRNVAVLEDTLAKDKRVPILPAGPEGNADDGKGTRVLATVSAQEIFGRAVKLDREARKDLEEGGVWTLHLAIGLLAWRESEASRVDRFAPLLLLPVRLELDRARERVELARHDEAPVGNPTLVEHLKQQFGIKLPWLEAPPEDDHGVDVPLVFREVAGALAGRPGWQVLEEAYLSLFAFQKLLMWRDLQQHSEALFGTGVARLFAEKGRATDIGGGAAVDPRTLDKDPTISRLPLVVDADSSQLGAIAAATRGDSFVLQGPPGAGKSQTITNIVATALADGKRVLVVSEKMAALSVVHDRLSKVGLGPYCLELHSRKARKTDVMRSLEEAWAQADTPAGPQEEQFQAAVSDVEELRSHINGYVEALHEPVRLGETYRTLAARLASPSLKSAPRLPLDAAWVGRLEPDTWKAALSALEAFVVAARSVHPLAQHPFADCTPERSTAEGEHRLGLALEAAAHWLRELGPRRENLRDVLGTELPATLSAQASLAQFVAENAQAAYPSLARNPDAWDEYLNDVERHKKAQAAHSEERSALAARWDDGIYGATHLEPAVTRWLGTFFLFAWFGTFALRRTLARIARGRVPALPAVAEDLREARRLQDHGPALEAERVALLARLGPPWNSEGLATLAQITAQLGGLLAHARAFGVEVEGAMRALVCGGAQDHRDRAHRAGVQLWEHVRALDAVVGELHEAASLALEARRRAGDEGLAQLASLLERWQGRGSDFRNIAVYRERSKALATIGLQTIVDSFEKERVPLEMLRPALERTTYELLARQAQDAREPLRLFNGREHDRRVKAFRSGDVTLPERGAQLVASRLRSRLVHRPEGTDARSESQLVNREIKKKKQHMSIRDLFAKAPSVLARLKPCVLMSPLSVAQYLPPTPGLFDLLVFDEASQVTVWDAVGAIARAKQVVVVGDTKQMPPSNQFRSKGDDALDDGDAESVDLESVLDEAAALGLRELSLRWHYRSQNESLIAFSNEHFYKGQLQTFPSSQRADDEHGLSLRRLPKGTYEGEGRNSAEAKAVVDHLLERLRRFPAGKRSFGIVAFGRAQADAIEDLVDEARRRDPALEKHFEGAEPVFIKNLENVQGDERDEILFSVTYGQERSGQLRLAFGPVSQDGGERRLNVAFTRAKARMVVFTSLDPEDIDLSRVNGRGAQLLKAFLSFARSGAKSVAGASMSDAFDSDFERQAYDALRTMGHEVHTQVGASGYRIDLAVVDPQSPGRYVLGIECDGAAYHSGTTARDRDRLRQAVLERLGWRLHRIWSTDWSQRRDQELTRLADAVNDALVVRPPPVDVEVDAPPSTKVQDGPRVPSLPPAKAAPTLGNEGSGLEFLDDGTVRVSVVRRSMAALALPPLQEQAMLGGHIDSLLAEALVGFVQVEGPVHMECAARAFLKHAGARKLTEKWSLLVDRLARSSAHALSVRGPFLWPRGVDPVAFWTLRLPEDGAAPDLDTMCDEELATVHAFVLIRELAVAEEALFQLAGRRLNIKRTGNQVAVHLRRGLNCLLQRGPAVRDADVIRWTGLRPSEVKGAARP